MSDVTAPAVRFFLSSALSPRVQAPSRWIAVNATSRKAFTITGKESGSPFLHFLASGRTTDNQAAFEAAVRSLGVDDSMEANSGAFVAWYRQLNYGYPFLDYSKGEARSVDADLMSAYAESGEAPPVITERVSPIRGLTPGRILSSQSVPQEASEDLIAGWLRATGGITHLRQLSHSMIAFRTSPSGGARHPTDLGVRLGDAWPGGLAGNWWYEPLNHGLTAAASDVVGAPPLRPTEAVFTISSHVRRAMWRYRDVRAFRPVLIDAGHVVETLIAVISYCGWTAWWQPAAGFVESGGDLDPVFGYVIATPERLPPLPADGLPTPEKMGVATEPLRTNPLISLHATPHGLAGENHLQRGTPRSLTPAMIDTLAYATPSSRGDRPTMVQDLLKNDLTVDDLQSLVDGGFLLADSAGSRLWKLARAWSEHDWFLSLLVHCCAITDARPSLAEPTAFRSPYLPQALDRRRTSRSLIDLPLPAGKAADLLASLNSPPPGLKIVLSTRHCLASLERGTYLLGDQGFEFQTSDVPSDEQIVTAAIGQPWARPFSCIVWLIPSGSLCPGLWEAAMIECGRVAQRLTLAVCDDPRVGVFQSPALVDDKLAGLLAGHASLDGAYLIGIGVIAQAPSHLAAPRFLPSSLFHPRDSLDS